MAELASLPADQRAALQLLLTQGQTYEQLGQLLNIDPGAVRRRAHSGLDALAPAGGPDRREDIADYLLGQQGDAEREATRAHLAESPSAREWARDVAGALRELAPDAVPDIPDGAAPTAAEPAPPPPPAEEPAPPPPAEEPAPALREEPAPALRKEPRPRGRAGVPAPPRPSSRLGGALLLAGAAIVVAVVVVLLVNGGGGDNGKGSTLSKRPSTTKTTPANQPVAQINLFAPNRSPNTVGLAQIFRNGNRRAVVIAAQGLLPGTYALWLYNSPTDARLLGFVPQRVTSNGRFATQGELPTNASRYGQLVVTRERVTTKTRKPPARPGPLALQGKLSLG
jgi:hypothetical protein